MQTRAEVESMIFESTHLRQRNLEQLQHAIDREVDWRTNKETETRPMYQELRSTLLEQQFIDNVLYVQKVCESGVMCKAFVASVSKGLVVWRALTDIEHRFSSGWFRDWLHSHILEDLKNAQKRQKVELGRLVLEILIACAESNDAKIWEVVRECLNKRNWSVNEFFDIAIMILTVLQYIWRTKGKEDQTKFRNRVEELYGSANVLTLPEWPLDDASCCEQILRWRMAVDSMKALEWRGFYPYLHWSAIRFRFAGKPIPKQLQDLCMTQDHVDIMGQVIYNHLDGLADRGQLLAHSAIIIDFLIGKQRMKPLATEGPVAVIANKCFGDSCIIFDIGQLKAEIAKQLPKPKF